MRRLLAALSVVAVAMLNHSLVAPAVADDTSAGPEITQAVLAEEGRAGAVSNVTITFDEPTDSVDVEAQLEELFQEPMTMEVSGNTAYEQGAPAEPLKVPRRLKKIRGLNAVSARTDSNYGDKVIHCNQFYALVNSHGRFTVQRECGVRAAPWSYKLSAGMRDLCTSYVAETGLQWTKNGVSQPANASHLVPDNYLFHGTFRGHSGVGAGDDVRYWDYFSCRHSIAGGGDVLLKIFGTLRFRRAA